MKEGRFCYFWRLTFFSINRIPILGAIILFLGKLARCCLCSFSNVGRRAREPVF